MRGEEGLLEGIGTISWEQCCERLSFAPYYSRHRHIAESELMGFDRWQPLSDDFFEMIFGGRPNAFADRFAGFFVVVLVEDEV